MPASMKLIIDDRECEFSIDELSLPEGILLEEEWGVRLLDLEAQMTSGVPSMRTLAALVWLMQVRTIAADQDIMSAAAARQLPVATFDTKFKAIRQPPGEPENPTSAGTRTPGTRTTRATSAKPKQKRTTTRSNASAT